ncbi:MAG TPA: hypothetical protein VF658_05210 [Pyrinomonadaceae bacterium]
MNEPLTNNREKDAVLPSTGFEGGDACSEPTINGPFPAVVMDAATGNQSVGGQPVIINLSASNFCLHLALRIEAGAELLVSAHVSRAVVVMRGTVLRVEELEKGIYGLVVTILQYRIFSEIVIDEQFSNDPPPFVAEFLRTEA